jgi:hypothetical protein
VVVEGDDEDEKGNPLPLHSFTLWEPVAINGHVWHVGGPDLLIPSHDIVAQRPSWGGEFARLLFPLVLAQTRANGSSASEQEAWGWGPPALISEGDKIQPSWLYNYLLEPTVIRPAAVLRMPKYGLSATEAAQLVDYFSAASGHPNAYAPDLRTRKSVAGQLSQHRNAALQLLLDRTTFCAKCHVVGDFTPGGAARTILAPDLSKVGHRLQPDYLNRWLGDPRSILPYTAMPINFPPSGPPLGQDIYPGTSQEQIEAIADLLLNYETYMTGRISIPTLMKKEGTP